MDWNPDREKRIKRHSLAYRVPRDRQLASLEIDRPGEIVVVTDTLFPVRCPTCDNLFEKPTQWQSSHAFNEHNDEQHPQIPSQYDVPSWFRELKEEGEADIIDLMRNYETRK
jgi:hypothetical protein